MSVSNHQGFYMTCFSQIKELTRPHGEPFRVFKVTLNPELHFRGLTRWGKGRWGIGNKPQYSKVYARDPLTHLPSSHLLSPLTICLLRLIRALQLGWSFQAAPLGSYMGGCQNYGPFLGTLNIRCRIIIRTQKRTIILTTTHMF